MRVPALIALVIGLSVNLSFRAEDTAPIQPADAARAVKPLPPPSNAKINSVVTNKPAPGAAAKAGQGLTADGAGKTEWTNIKGTALDSSPASAGSILTADGNGGAVWSELINSTAITGNLTGNVTGNVSGSSASFTGPLAGDVTGTQSATVVSLVGGVTAANVAS